MYSYANRLIGVFAIAALIGCASTPPNVQNFPSGTDPVTEIHRTDAMLKQARSEQHDVLSPDNFKSAEKSLEKAQEYQSKGKDPSKVLEQVAYSQAWLRQANEKAQLTSQVMGDISDARRGADMAGAREFFPKEWDKAGKELEKITKNIEDGDLGPANKDGAAVVQMYRDLERKSVVESNLGRADRNIQAAIKDGAETKAPRTYSLAMNRYDQAQRVIAQDPRNSAAIAVAARAATRESQHLLEVTKKVNMGNSEDLVLLAERQQRAISGLRREAASTEQELMETQGQLTEVERKQALLNRAERIRTQLKPSEADVIAQEDSLTVRLKGLTFPVNRATLDSRDRALLQKVDTALRGMGPAKVRIEGHTDSTGSADVNRALSQARAEAVQKYIVTNGLISSERVEAVGKGFENPVGDNRTPQGRAQNRRIDLVIEPLTGME